MAALFAFTSAPPRGETRLAMPNTLSVKHMALLSGTGAYLIWGFVPLVMQAVGRTAEADRALRNLHLFNISGVPSVGLISSGINGLPWGVDAIALAISRDLFTADVESFYREFIGYDEPDANEGYDRQRTASR